MLGGQLYRLQPMHGPRTCQEIEQTVPLFCSPLCYQRKEREAQVNALRKLNSVMMLG